MNVWDILINILGWFLLVIIVLAGLVILAALILGIKQGIRKTIQQKRGKKAPANLSDEEVYELSKKAASKLYSRAIFAELSENAFKQGVTYALKTKRGEHANSV